MKKAIFAVILIFAMAAQVSAQAPEGFFFGDGCVDLSGVKNILGKKAGSTAVLEIPAADEGRLFCEGVEVERFDILSRKELDSLVFMPANENAVSRLVLLPIVPGGQNAESINLAVTSGRPDTAAASDIPAGLYAWAWARQSYFSETAKLCKKQV